MEFRLSAADGLPVYRQLMNQVKLQIASGRLAPGQELPTIRALAERLVINPNTVVHAYAELAREGVVVTRHGSGTYVAEGGGRVSRRAAGQALAPKVDSLLSDAAHLQIELEDLVQLIRDRHDALRKSRAS